MKAHSALLVSRHIEKQRGSAQREGAVCMRAQSREGGHRGKTYLWGDAVGRCGQCGLRGGLWGGKTARGWAVGARNGLRR